ncbi:MAG TPA: hypothetical protein VF846_19595 [Thermoanaerobaculia bacterium]|jgi:hypothetical protein
MTNRDEPFTLLFHNDSTRHGSVCVFQTDPNVGAEAQTVAWLVKPATPSTSVFLQWRPQYCFVWAETGELSPGVTVRASQAWPATDHSAIRFTRIRGSYTFTKETGEGSGGTLSIATDAEIVADQAVIGIGMAELPTFVVPAKPEQSVTFTPQPSYAIAFGDIVPGEFLSQATLENAVALPFSRAATSVLAVLTEDEKWIVTAR